MIQFPQSKPPTWTFEDFVYPNGSNPVEAWRDEQSGEAQGTFESVLKDMRKIDDHLNWGAWRGYLHGEAKKHKIWEVGFKADGRQYRVFGIFAGTKVIILLAGCYHKNKVYTPPDAIPTAIKRARALKEGTGKTHARQISTDF